MFDEQNKKIPTEIKGMDSCANGMAFEIIVAYRISSWYIVAQQAYERIERSSRRISCRFI